jgi:thiamine biosynthesis lipoprotein
MHRILTLGLCLSCGVLFAAAACAEEAFTFQHENILGTSLELRVFAAQRAQAEAAEARVLAEIERLSAIFSTYSQTSEFSRWQQTPVGHSAIVSQELCDVLAASDKYRELSGGAFQPAAQVLSKLWSRGEAEQRLPLAAEIVSAVARANATHWRLDAAKRTATRLSDAPLTFNAVATGYMIDRACAAALRPGEVESLILNIGGDLRICGPAARMAEIADPHGADNTAPLVRLWVADLAVVTSGGERRGFDIQGHHYSHIFDPRTGRPVEHVISSTVVAPRTIDADALATICNVLPPAESLALIDRLPDVACLLITADGHALASRAWGQLRTEFVALQAPAVAAAKPAWNGGMEMKVDFEINNPGGGGYRRPYVAVWVEDSDGFPVRTLILWVGGSRWVPDLRRWYKTDRERKLVDDTDLVARAGSTRKPGQYSAVWDGLDGNDKLCKPGEYTVYIEAAREHGTYQLIRQKVTLGTDPQSHKLTGNIEIKSAQLDYRRAATADKTH